LHRYSIWYITKVETTAAANIKTIAFDVPMLALGFGKEHHQQITVYDFETLCTIDGTRGKVMSIAVTQCPRLCDSRACAI
jgi:hypothetical protein